MRSCTVLVAFYVEDVERVLDRLSEVGESVRLNVAQFVPKHGRCVFESDLIAMRDVSDMRNAICNLICRRYVSLLPAVSHRGWWWLTGTGQCARRDLSTGPEEKAKRDWSRVFWA